jgi:single-stranded-DNA-specific exonuclease RecJ
MSRVWIEPTPTPIPPELLAAVGGNVYIAAALLRRGICTPDAASAFLDPTAYHPTSGRAFPDMLHAVTLVLNAISAQCEILVWGDFDVDGQTATAILVSALQTLGARVNYHLPVRGSGEGHGVSLTALQNMLAQNPNTGLVLTCDTGITANDAVDFLRQQHIPVIITDHHVPEGTLPNADALVCSSRLPEGHPLSTLSGAGVAYKLAECLFEEAGNGNVEDLLDLATIGLVTDIVPLVGDTRYLVQKGLVPLRQAKRPVVRAILEQASSDPQCLNEETIGFVIGPRLNALGKMGDANPAVKVLLTANEDEANAFAAQLEELNHQRQEQTRLIETAIEKRLHKTPELAQNSLIVLGEENWPAGLVGTAASGIAQAYGKPTILFAIGADGLARGSARSVGTIDIIDAIRAQSALLKSYGGHAGAAGLALPADQLDRFAQGINQYVAQKYAGRPTTEPLAIDHYVYIPDLSVTAVNDLLRLAPFGAGNPRPVLVARDVTVALKRRMGSKKEHLRVHVQDSENNSLETVFWNGGDKDLPEGPFDLAFLPGINQFRGETSVQGEWLDTKTINETSQPKSEQEIAIIDRRMEPTTDQVLAGILAQPNTIVWADGAKRSGACRRSEILSASCLVIWTAPTTREDISLVVQKCKPKTVVLFNAPGSGEETSDSFLVRLAGLCKYVLRTTGGKVTLAALADSVAQSERSVRHGLGLLAATQAIQVAFDHETVQISSFSGMPEKGNPAALSAALEQSLAETAAFRRLYPKINARALIYS